MNTAVALGAFFGFLAVVLGAFGAHALRRKLSAEHLLVFHTGVTYQMYHALVLVGVGILEGMGKFSPSLFMLTMWTFVVGIVLFSGSLYLLTVTGVRKVGAITPLGGLSFLAGWVCLFVAICRPAV
jgi:uncharacterized membrane protein YgdD (TMEM256/DUF423 family)